MKDKLIRTADESVTLEPNIDVDAFMNYRRQVDIHFETLNNLTSPTNDNGSPTIKFGSKIYFDRLPKAVRILNEMIHVLNESASVGVELSTSDGKIYIFPATIVNPFWVNITIIY